MKVAFFELLDFRPREQTDWAQVLLELSSAGVSTRKVSDALGIDYDVLLDWRHGKGRGPTYDPGRAILAMHAKYCKG